MYQGFEEEVVELLELEDSKLLVGDNVNPWWLGFLFDCIAFLYLHCIYIYAHNFLAIF
jgi:hypothetical protein